jgi:hypothetical protein
MAIHVSGDRERYVLEIALAGRRDRKVAAGTKQLKGAFD